VRRRAFYVFILVSLVICLATAALWIRSYKKWDTFLARWPAQGMGIRSAHGCVIINIKLTDVSHDVPDKGLYSSEPIKWAFSDNSIMMGDDDPLPIFGPINFPIFTKQNFACHYVEGDPPNGGTLSESYWQYGPAGPRPVVGDRYIVIRFPHWSIIALFSLPALYWCMSKARQFHRKRKIQAGYCPTCGYDLRATPGRCPECGTVIDQLISSAGR
jgi:hypothetical protein